MNQFGRFLTAILAVSAVAMGADAQTFARSTRRAPADNHALFLHQCVSRAYAIAARTGGTGGLATPGRLIASNAFVTAMSSTPICSQGVTSEEALALGVAAGLLERGGSATDVVIPPPPALHAPASPISPTSPVAVVPAVPVLPPAATPPSAPAVPETRIVVRQRPGLLPLWSEELVINPPAPFPPTPVPLPAH